MLIALNQFRRRHRKRLAALFAALALGSLVFAAHGALAERHMGDEMATCLATAQTAAMALAVMIAAVGASGWAPLSPAWIRAQAHVHAPAHQARARPIARTRAGPAVLQIFRC